MRDTPEAIERWESQLEGFRLYSSYQGAVVSMEKQFNSSGKNSKDFHNCLFFKKSKKTWRNGRSSQRSSQTGSSSCQCSMTLSGTRMMRLVFRMPHKSRVTQRDSRKDIGHSWAQGRKRRGMELLLALKKGSGIVQPPSNECTLFQFHKIECEAVNVQHSQTNKPFHQKHQVSMF